ncbi:MAG TPA: DEAD/DEAH box helicase [Opitutaceae bacterium]|jgi:superfamily II DNA or RNA helicase|nr:DEAD/DEAH box helicase [Opitutaceae bacterium]
MLRLFLPPNLAAAAARNAIALKLELEVVSAPPPELLPGLALLAQWTGNANRAPAGSTNPVRAYLQLDRGQLRELLVAFEGQPVFRWAQAPDAVLPWKNDRLPGVSEPLEESILAASLAPPAIAPGAETAALKKPVKPVAVAAEPLTVDGSEHFLAVTLPSREHPAYADALDLLKRHGFVLEPSNRKWWLRDRHKTLSFLAVHGTRLREKFGARFTPNFEQNTARLQPAEIVCETARAGDAFDVTVGLRAGSSPESAVRDAIAAGRHYLESDDGVILIDPAQLHRLEDAQRALGGGVGPPSRRTHRVGTERAVEVEEILAELAPGFRPPAEWAARTEALRNLSKLAPAPVPAGLQVRLRLYQQLGVAWLWHLHRLGLGGILADEMGLGKTLQALTLLAVVRHEAAGAPAPCLVVCPATLMENWRREATRFTPELRIFVHHGGHRLAGADDFAARDLVITSYGTLTRDQDLFAAAEFACVVGDEAQHIKNRRSQNAQALRSLRARGRFLLTGTPVENSLDDLRSLFEFLLPGYIERVPAGARSDDRAWLDGRLRAKAAPYILRRTKRAVAPELPEKIEQVVWCELAVPQAALYRTLQEQSERELFDLEASGAGEGRLRLAALTQLLRLRQVCCDPRLVPAGAALAGGPAPFDGSAKLEAFRELLAEAVDGGHRLLVFSQFTSLLALLRTELEAQGAAYCYLDGAMTARARQAEIDRFQGGSDTPVFLLSLKAGGTGLNLTAADTVVHFDPWWNPAVEAQATDRAHRLGQAKVVTSYKLVCAGTVEEKVLALQDEKRALLADVFDASDETAARLSLGDLKSLLRN